VTRPIATSLTPAEKNDWEENGFFVRRGFASGPTCRKLWDRAVELARAEVAGESIAPAYVLRETRLDHPERLGEERASKIFRLHRDDPTFHAGATDPELLAIMADILGPDVDCFLSQFIFKQPGALGQPWHQDAFYFPFDRDLQVGAWLAITEAGAENSPLWVLPGSQTEAVHDAITDPRPDAPFGYVEIVDHEMDGAERVLMQPGDLLVFHGHLMHRSTDHEAGEVRAAMVYHYAESATVDRTEQIWGQPSPNNDWMTVLRDHAPV